MKLFTRSIFIFVFALLIMGQNIAQPNPPSNLTAVQSSWQNYLFVKLTWQGSQPGPMMNHSGFNVYRKDGAIADTGKFQRIAERIPMNNWMDKFVHRGNTYSYYVTAIDRSGESKGSDTVEVTIDSSVVKAVVTGTLKNSVNSDAIIHGRVAFIPVFGFGMDMTFTDSTGKFSAQLYPGTYIIYTTADGYFPVFYNNVSWIKNATKLTLKSGDSLDINIALQPRTPPQKFILSGSVSDSLGNAVRAWVEVYNVSHNSYTRRYFHAVTDSAGKYSVTVLGSDTIVVYAHSFNHDYIPQFYNGKSNFLTADRIAVNGDTSGINFILKHKPVYDNGISGVVMNSDTVGVRAIIHAIRKGDFDDHHKYSTVTDSLGNYTFTHLIPGQYILLAIPQDGYKPTFFRYDGAQTLNWKDADSVVVTSSGTVTGINFTVNALVDSGMASVNGAVTDNSGNPVVGAFVFAQDENQNIYSFGVTDQSGNYSIAGLIPGNYSVSSSSYGYSDAQTSSVTLDYSANYSTSTSFTITPQTVTAISTDNNASLVKSFELSQNYPNPFNPSTVINFTVPVESKVVLKVYNILGKEVSTLVNDVKQAGSYNITFNASQLASGVYFYQLRAGNFVSTKKLILMK